MKKYKLEIVVFLCGASVMILELVGARILAPYIGTSIIVWTSLIGIILGSLSLGYWYGGKMADQNPDYKIFSLIIFLAAILAALIYFIEETVLNLVSGSISNIYFAAILSIFLLFALPSALLGAVSPYAIRLKIKDINKSGRISGNLYAVSTMGSIVGTFLAGFFLIPFLGSLKIILVISAILIISSLIADTRNFIIVKIFFLLSLFFLLSSASNNINKKTIDFDTQYNRIRLIQGIDSITKRPALGLVMDPQGMQAAMFLDKDDDLVFKYTKFFRLAKYFKPDLKNSLLIGGAAYSYPKDYLKKHPDANIDVVEIDKKLTEIAKDYFNLPQSPRMNIYHEDGRTYLNKTEKKYDVVFMDAFSSRHSIPHQLTTIEAIQKIFNILESDGVVIVNIISAIEGEKGRFLQSEYKTYKTIFPQAYLFPVESSDAGKVQNIVLVAIKSNKKPTFKSDDPEINSYLNSLWAKEVGASAVILTDDYAPVDYYVMKAI